MRCKYTGIMLIASALLMSVQTQLVVGAEEPKTEPMSIVSETGDSFKEVEEAAVPESEIEDEKDAVVEKHVGWYQDAHKSWYYADGNGTTQTGWQWIDGAWYYLDGANAEYPGIMHQDTSAVIDGRTYFFNGSGAMQTGWVLRPEGWYYADGSGAMQTGWQWIGGAWYYLDGASAECPGIMHQNTSAVINGQTYFFNGSGAMQTGWILRSEGWYYADGSGAMQTGWQWIGGAWYYLDGANAEYPGVMVRNIRMAVGGQEYFFNGSGAMQTGWVLQPEGWYYADGSGAVTSGWQLAGNTWYYLDQEQNGLMQTGWKVIGDKWYYLHGSGAMATNWLFNGADWYYMAGDGAMKTGWVSIGGSWYYFYLEEDSHIEENRHGAMAYNTCIDGWDICESGVAVQDLKGKIENIKNYVGVKYVSGGVTPLGWDCSGFTQWSLMYLGVAIPRTAAQQAIGGTTINKNDMSTWRPGDILAYKNSSGSIGHVALYLGDGKLMHALSTRYNTLIQDVHEYERWDSKTTLAVVKRYL